MSSASESLLFRIDITRTGMSVQEINAFTNAIKTLAGIKVTSGSGVSAELTKIGATAKSATGQLDPLIGKVKQVDSTLKSGSAGAKTFQSTIQTLGTATGTASAGMDRFRGTAAGLLNSLSPLANTINTVNASMNMYTSSGTKVQSTNSAIATSTTATAASLERIRAGYTNAMSGSQGYVASSTAAVAANQRMIAGSTSLVGALNAQNKAIMDTTANVNKLATSQQAQQQQTMSMVRGLSTMFMGLMMLNQSMTDFRLNQESMQDLNQKLADSQERYNMMVERFGEGSYMANQAQQTLLKTERAIRYENREMANQIQNQIFLMAMIAQNIMSDAIPAFMNWGESMQKIRGIMDGIQTKFTSLGGGIKAFAQTLFGIAPAATSVASSFGIVDGAIGTFNRNAQTANTASRTLTTGMGTLGPAAAGAANSMAILPAAIGNTDRATRSIIPGLQGMSREFALTSTILPGLGPAFGTVVTGTTASTRAFGDVERAVAGANGQFRGIGVAVGQTVPGLTRMGDSVHVLGGNMDKTERSSSRMVGAANALRGGFSRLGSAIGVSGGAGLIAGFAALTAGIAVYSTNAGGARDAMHGFGVAVGSTNPLLRAAGQALVGIAGAMGMTGESAEQVDRHFQKAGDAFHDFTTEWHNTLEGMKNDTNAAVAFIGQALDSLSQHAGSLGIALFAPNAGVEPEKDYDKDLEEFKKTYRDLENMKSMGITGGLRSLGLETGMSDEQLEAIYDLKRKEAGGETEKDKMNKEWEAYRNAKLSQMDLGTGPPPPQMSERERQEYLDYLKEQSPLYKDISEKTGEARMALQDYVDMSGNATFQGELARQGKALYLQTLADEAMTLDMETAALDLNSRMLNENSVQQMYIAQGVNERKQAEIDLRTENLKGIGILKEWNNQLGQQAYQNELVTAGQQEQAGAWLKLREGIYQNIGVIGEYNSQLQQQSFINDQVTAGYQAQQIAFNDQEVAIANNIGALAAYGEAYESQRLQNMAFTEGMIAQEQKFFDMVIATEQAKGSYERLGQQMESGIIQQAAFEQGFAETQLAIRQQTVDLEAAKGSINAYIDAIQSGEAIQNAMTEGIIEQRQALIDSILGFHQSAAGLKEYNSQLETGLPQGIAFQQTLVDLARAASEQEIAFAQAAATLQFHTQQSKDLNNFQAEIAASYLTGRDAVFQWTTSLQNSAHEQAGVIEGFKIMAQELGVLPEGFNGGIEALQKLIGLATRMPDVIGAALGELEGIFDGWISGFGDALRKGEGDLDDAIDEFAESLGIKFNKGVSEALEFEAGGDLFTKLSKEFSALFIGIGDNLSAKDFEHLKKQVIGRLDEVMDGVLDDVENGPTKEKVEGIMKSVINTIKNTSVEDIQTPGGIIDFISKISTDLLQLDDVSNNFAATMNSVMTAIAEGDINKVNELLSQMATEMLGIDGMKFDAVSGQFNSLSHNINLTKEQATQLADELENIKVKYGTGGKPVAEQGLEQISKAYEEQGIYDHVSVVNFGPGGENKYQTGISSDEGMTPKDDGSIASMAEQLNALNLAIAQIPVTMTTAFTQGVQNAAGQLNLLTAYVATSVTAWNTSIASFAVGITQQFTIGVQGAGTALSLFTGLVATAVTTWNTSITAVATGLVTQFSIGTTGAATALDLLSQFITTAVTTWNTMFASVGVGLATQITIGVQGAAQNIALLSEFIATFVGTAATNFLGLQNVVLQVFATIANAGVEAFGVMLQAATSVATSISRGYNLLANAIVGYFAQMASRSQTSFQQINTAATNTANTINRVINAAVNAAISYISQLSTRSASAFQTMANNATKVADAVRSIGSAAASATSQVEALASALDSIPSQVNTTINVGLSGPGAAYLQGGTTGQVYFAEGGNEFYAEGSGAAKRNKKRRAIVGETGDELVTRIGLRTGKMSQETVGSMKTLTNLGLHEPEMLRVRPLTGYYAQRFTDRLGKGLSALGGIGKAAVRGMFAMGTPGSGTESPNSVTVSAGQGFGVSPGAQPNTAMGPITLSTDGRIHLYDGQSKTIDQWRQLNDNQRIINAESDDVGIKSIPEDKYLNEDYSISNTNSGTYSRYVRNTKWESGPNAGQDSGVYNTGNGGGGSTNPNAPLPNQPSKSPASFGDIVQVGGGRPDMTISQWNAQSENTRRNTPINSIPSGYDLYGDYTIRPSGSTGGGGTGGTTGGNHPPGTFGGTPVGDSETLGPGGSGYYKTVTGYNVPGYAVTPGHGATSPTKWTNPNMDPRNWEAKPMVDPDKQGLWKVVDNKGVNIIADLKSEAEANEFIQEHIYHYNPSGAGNGPPSTGGGGTTNPPPSTGGGGNGGGGTTNPPPSTGGGSGGTSGTPTQVVTGGNVRIEQYPNGQRIIIDGKVVLDTTGGTGGTGTGGTGGGGTGTGGTGGSGVQMSNAWLAGAAGTSYNHNTSTHPGVTGVGAGTGGTGTGGTGGGGTGSGTGAVGDTVVGYNGNFNYEINNRRLKIENGRVVENSLTTSDMAAARAAFKSATGRDLVFVNGGTGGTGGGTGTTNVNTNVGTGTGFGTGTGGSGNSSYTDERGNNFNNQNDVNTTSNVFGTGTGTSTSGSNTGGGTGTSGTGTGGTNIVTGTQTISQTGSGQNLYYQNQNGKINTNMTPEQLAKFGLSGAGGTGTGGTGTGGTGTSGTSSGIRDTIFKSLSMVGGLAPYLDTTIPSSPFQDSVNGAIDNQADPRFLEYSGSCDSASMGPVPGAPGGDGGDGGGNGGNTPPGSGGYFDWLKTLLQGINRMIYGMVDRLKVNITNQVNQTAFWRITNDSLIQSMKRY